MRQLKLWFLIVCSMAACAKTPPRVASITPPLAVRGEAAVEFLRNDERRKFNVAFVIAKPDRLRIEAIDPALGRFAIAATDGRTMWLTLPHRQKRYERKVHPQYVERLIGLRMEVEELLELLTGHHRADGEFERVVVTYGEYRTIERINFPTLIDVKIPERRIELKIKYTDIAFGGKVEDELFKP